MEEKDSYLYFKILKYIKNYGIEKTKQMIVFDEELNKIYNVLIVNAVLQFVEQNPLNIDLYLKNALKLYELDVNYIYLCHDLSYFKNYKYHKRYGFIGEEKKSLTLSNLYSDGFVENFNLVEKNGNSPFPYEKYLIEFDKTSWILETETHLKSQETTKKITMLDFGVDLSKLPLNEEIMLKSLKSDLKLLRK